MVSDKKVALPAVKVPTNPRSLDASYNPPREHTA